MTSGFAEVIGDPIAHSKSPAIQQFWLEMAGLDFTYRATQVTRAGLGEYLRERRQDPDWRGCNVTMPLKLDAVIQADDASDRAVAAGAANILVPTDGKLLAGNTDVGAVLQLLGPLLAKTPGGGITLLGNGGAARAVLIALRMLNIEDVRIQARDTAAAYKLAVEFGHGQEPRPFTAPIESHGLINATPMGMPGVASISMDISAMPATGWVFDMVTEPAETPLLAAAKARGLGTIDGLAMLIEQAADSFRLLFGKDAPRQYDAQLMKLLRP
jgi:shikimate dehydrogenase